MKVLDKSKAYDLRDLNDEQLNELWNWLIKNDKNWSCFVPIYLRTKTVYYSEEKKQWVYYGSNADVVNALTLFETKFKQGDKVLVRYYEDADWIETVYVVEHNGRHYVESYDESELLSYKFIKPYEEQKKWYKRISPKNRITYDLMDTTEKLKLTEAGFVVLEITDKEFINQLENN